jgi:hypothetical protein
MAVAAGVAAAGPAGAAAGQDQVVASLPWLHGTTAGPNGSDYEPPNDARDLWIIEDFSIDGAVFLSRFESYGTIYPAPLALYDVNVRIYDAMPPAGNVVLASVPRTGRILVNGFDYRLVADFGGQYLAPGSYYLVWNASTRTNPPYQQIAIYWAQSGPHAVGGGLPDNAWQWNPGGGWGFPNNIHPVPAQLGGGGQIGVNFYLFGTPGCYANCDQSTEPPVLNVEDFVCFQTRFAAGQPYANCDGSTSPPTLNVADFVCFMQRFAAGCP